MGASSTWIQLQKAVLDGTMETAIKEAVSTISPVRTAMIRRSQLLQSGVTGEDGPTLDEIHAEEKAAAAASLVEEVDVLAAAEASAELAEVDGDTSGAVESDEESSEESTEDTVVEEVVEEPADEADETPEADDGDSPDYTSMTVAELKGLLKEAGKPVSGKKASHLSPTRVRFQWAVKPMNGYPRWAT
jgi:hypothetical protein